MGNTGQTQGVLTFTFTFPDSGKTKYMVAYDLDRVEYDSLVKVVRPRPFVSYERQIIVLTADPSLPRAISSSSTGSITPGQTLPTSTVSQSSISSTPGSRTSAIPSSPTVTVGSPDQDSRSALEGPSTFRTGNVPVQSDTFPEAGSEGGETTSDSSQSQPPPAKGSDIATIIGATLGSLASIILILFFIFCCRRQGKHSLLIEKSENFQGERMIKRREENQLQQKDIAHSKDFDPEAPMTTMFAPHSSGHVDDTSSTFSGASDSERASETTLESHDYTIHTISESRNEPDVTSTIESTSTEITHEYITPRADRQMEIEKKIFELQGQIIRLSDRSRSSDIGLSTPSSMNTEIIDLRERVAKLKKLQGEGWAMELTEKVPLEMYE
ncbi:hypothetical protein PQX77_000906 [Marasmius sp. AFHP31]|nr:hypothetical protein PQX77_000906 [Marasmius sp. AFHP31]